MQSAPQNGGRLQLQKQHQVGTADWSSWLVFTFSTCVPTPIYMHMHMHICTCTCTHNTCTCIHQKAAASSQHDTHMHTLQCSGKYSLVRRNSSVCYECRNDPDLTPPPPWKPQWLATSSQALLGGCGFNLCTHTYTYTYTQLRAPVAQGYCPLAPTDTIGRSTVEGLVQRGDQVEGLPSVLAGEFPTTFRRQS